MAEPHYSREQIMIIFEYETLVLDPEDPNEPAVAKHNGKMFHVSPHTGFPLYEIRFDWVGHYVQWLGQEIAIVRLGNKWFDITKKGTRVRRKRSQI